MFSFTFCTFDNIFLSFIRIVEKKVFYLYTFDTKISVLEKIACVEIMLKICRVDFMWKILYDTFKTNFKAIQWDAEKGIGGVRAPSNFIKNIACKNTILMYDNKNGKNIHALLYYI